LKCSDPGHIEGNFFDNHSLSWGESGF
jgi:hypothetical protein